MTSTKEDNTDIPVIAVSVDNWPSTQHADIEGSGFTYAAASGEKWVLLPQDPLRISAQIFTSGAIYIGTPGGVQSMITPVAATQTQQATLIPASLTAAVVVTATSEVWAIATATAQVSVWTERRVA